MFGLLLLEEVPITGGKFALDVGWAPDFRLLSSPSDSDHPHQQEGPSSHQKHCGKGCSRGSEMKENREHRIQNLVTRGQAANLEAALSAMRLNPLLSALR
jgi:hypothetical protein